MRRRIVAATFRWPLLPLVGTAFQGGPFWLLLPVKKSPPRRTIRDGQKRARLRRRPLQRQEKPEGRKFLQTEEQGSRRRRSGIKHKRTRRTEQCRSRRTNEKRRRNRRSTRHDKNNRPGHGRILRMATRHGAIHRRRPGMMVATGHRHVLRRIGVTRTFLRPMPMQWTHRPIAAAHASSLQHGAPGRRPEQHHRQQTHTRPQPSSRSVGIVAHSLHFPES
jgi:hypothetical protein